MPDFGIFRGFNEKLFGDKLYAGQLPINLGLIGSESFTSQLLDIYPNAAAAYSIRRLSGTYSGKAIRVRRTNNNELDIGFTSTGELDTAALLAFTGTGALDNGFVTKWYDQSGNARDATQVTAASQPMIVSSGSVITENGKPAIDSDGMNDRFSISDINLSADYGIIIVSKLKDFLTNMYLGTSSTSGYIWAVDGQNTGFRVRHDGEQGGADFSGIKTLNQELHLFQRYGTTMAHSRNSVNTTNTERSPQGLNFKINLILDGYTPSSLYSINAKTQEIIIYPSDQSSNATGIETNINDFYSIY
jgi:hypothetical protein